MKRYNSIHTTDTFNQFRKDFKEWVKEDGVKVMDIFKDEETHKIDFEVWIVTPTRIFNKKIIELNKQALSL